MSEFEQFAAEVVALVQSVKDHCDAEIANRDAVISELRAQVAAIPAGKDGIDGKPGADGAVGRDGQPGASVVLADLDPMVSQCVRRAVDAIPAPRDGKDGKDGRDGASVPLEAVQSLVGAEVSRAVSALPRPIDGKDGQQGPAGRDGADAVIDVDQVVEALKHDPEAVAMLRGASGANGAPGERGAPGLDGKAGERGQDGARGERGADGAQVTPEQLREAIEHRFATWALDFERLATDRQRAAIDAIPLPRDGRDGKDGKAGFGLEDFEFDVELINERQMIVSLRAGGREVKRALTLPVMVYRETWRATERYQRGDVVTFGGQLFFASQATQAKPGESGDWRLAVRRGKDGKDAAE